MNKPITQTLPMLPLRDVVVYPHLVIPLFVGRDKSIAAIEKANNGDKKIFLVAQKSAEKDEPDASDLYQTGTVATILQMLKLPDGTVKVLVEGVDRANVNNVNVVGDFWTAEVSFCSVKTRRQGCMVQDRQYHKPHSHKFTIDGAQVDELLRALRLRYFSRPGVQTVADGGEFFSRVGRYELRR